MHDEISTKPYLLRALHDWCTDNGYTPHIVVMVDEHTSVPEGHIHDGQITLNIGALATHHLEMGNDYITFQARFNGAVEHLVVPVATVSALYARETGAGMGFEVHASPPPSALPANGPTEGSDGDDTTPDDTPPASPRRNHLKVIK